MDDPQSVELKKKKKNPHTALLFKPPVSFETNYFFWPNNNNNKTVLINRLPPKSLSAKTHYKTITMCTDIKPI